METISAFGLVNVLRGGIEMRAKVKVLCRYSITMTFLAMECLVPFASVCKMCSIQYSRDTKSPQVFLALGYEAVENRV